MFEKDLLLLFEDGFIGDPRDEFLAQRFNGDVSLSAFFRKSKAFRVAIRKLKLSNLLIEELLSVADYLRIQHAREALREIAFPTSHD